MAVAAGVVSGCNVVPTSGEIEKYEISGRIVDKATGVPLPGAYVCAHYARIGAHSYSSPLMYAGSDGRYTIPANPRRVALLDTGKGAIPHLAAGYAGYGPALAMPAAISGPVHIDFELERLPVSMPPGISIAPFAGCADVVPPRKPR
jgi:hypothetical protein